MDISIHAPRVGGDALVTALVALYNKFQSTPPVWGATGIVVPAILLEVISIHAPRVGGDIFGTNYYAFCEISIHAPRVGGDGLARLVRTFFRISIHAPRVGGDFETVYAKVDCAVISIHAPRVGGDEKP